MKLQQASARFSDCTVTTKARTQAQIPAGIHQMVESQTQGGGASIIFGGAVIDVDYAELLRLEAAGLMAVL